MKYKGIRHNILNDAPFIGALIIANKCSMPCSNCINEHLKCSPYIDESAIDIIQKVKSNGLNEGIILSGLEWSEQPNDLVELAKCALDNSLEVMIYTHHSEDTFFNIVTDLRGLPVYVKFGLYDKTLVVNNNVSHGVKLATSNQYIKKF